VTRSDLIAIVAGAVLLVWFLRSGGVLENPYVAMLVAVAFAMAGWATRGVSPSGARAGAIVAFIFYAAGGWRLFVVLLAVFLITALATRAGREQKRALGVAEAPRGRSAVQVTANLVVPTALLVFFFSGPQRSWTWFYMAIAALAEVAADTVASEIGQPFGGQPRSIVTLRPVTVGANGGVTLLGTAAGTAAALTTSALLVISFRVFPFPVPVWQMTLAAVLGMLFDSLLGATLERRGVLNNDAVNLFGTAFAALACHLLLLSF
jgi:uncharacterized protein (TIGR00297 family)